MKRFLLSCFVLAIFSLTTYAQIVALNENFNNGTYAGDWNFGQGASVKPYNNPSLNCQTDQGIITSGIGGNAVSTFNTPAISYSSANDKITLSFDFFLLPANGACSGASNTAACPITMKVWIVPTTFSTSQSIPNSSIAFVGYQVVNILGKNTITFDASKYTMPSSYRFYVTFSASCNLSGTKFYLDNFNVVTSLCNSCPPVANDDYFLFGMPGWTADPLKANVYGGYADWASDLSVVSFQTKSLAVSPATNSGTDNDANLTKLQNGSTVTSGVVFELVTPLTAKNATGCGLNPNIGSLTFNSNGTFSYVRGANCVNSVYFTYRIKNNLTGTVSNIAKVTIAISENAALPVTYTSFNAVRRNKNVELKWETATEENNKGFYVQRNTGGEWKSVAFVFSAAANGNSNTSLSYAYNDPNSLKGVSQYRILQVDIDGKGKYSEIRSVRGEEQAARVVVFPNPSAGKLNVLFEDAVSVRDIQVMDIAGRMVRQYLSVTSNSITIDNLRDGFYNIQVTDRHTGVSTVEKAVVKKR